MEFNDKDREFMQLALEEAKKALKNQNYPVGAVLVIDGSVVGRKSNSLASDTNWASHAESALIVECSSMIKKHYKQSCSIELYSTLGPCLMCFGSSVLHRITRIVYACSDPHGGATNIDPKNLTSWYQRKWPKIEKGLFGKESYDLLVQFMKDKPEWKDVFELFKQIEQ